MPKAFATITLAAVAAGIASLGDWKGHHMNNCSNGNVIDHSGR